jgi:hypothetical protein
MVTPSSNDDDGGEGIPEIHDQLKKWTKLIKEYRETGS